MHINFCTNGALETRSAPGNPPILLKFRRCSISCYALQEALCILECGVMPATLAYLQTGVQARFVLTINPLTGLVFQWGNTQVPAKKATRARKEAGLRNTTKLL